MLEIKEGDDKKITMSETRVHDEQGLVNEYHEALMGCKVCERILEQGPQVLESTKMQIQMKDWSIEATKEKIDRLKKILDENSIDSNEAIKEIRKKYTDEQILEKTTSLIKDSKVEVKKIGAKYEISISTLNAIEDIIIELMSLETQLPEIMEAKVKDEATLKNTEKRIENTQKALEENQNKMKQIKVFFAGQHKNIDKLIDKYANERNKSQRMAKPLKVE